MRKKRARNLQEYLRRLRYQHPLESDSHVWQKSTLRPLDSWSIQPDQKESGHPAKTQSHLPWKNSWNKNVTHDLPLEESYHRYQESVHMEIHVHHYNRYVLRSDSHDPVQNKPEDQPLCDKASETFPSFQQ